MDKRYLKQLLTIGIIFTFLLLTLSSYNAIHPATAFQSPLIITNKESSYTPYKLPTNISPILGTTITNINGESVIVSSAIDNNNDIIVLGYTIATNYPTKIAYQNYLKGKIDIFLTKYTMEGTILWSTYFGGSGNDVPLAIKIDKKTDVSYITGWTTSPDFPTLHPINATLTGSYDLFLSSFNDNGLLLFSTYWGTTGGDQGLNMAINNQGTELTIVGNSFVNNSSQILLLKFNLLTENFISDKIVGGSSSDIAWSVAYDSENAIYIVGETESTDFPMLHAIQTTYAGNQDGFIQKYSDNLTLLYSSYIGGSQTEFLRKIGVLATNLVLIGGGSTSRNYPGTIEQVGIIQNETLIISSLNLTSNSLTTLEIGGNNNDYLQDFVITNTSVYFIGQTSSNKNLTLVNAFQGKYGGGNFDNLIGEVSNNLNSVDWLSYYGSAGDDDLLSLSEAKNYELVTVGWTNSTPFTGSSTNNLKHPFIAKIGDYSDSDHDGMPLWFESKYGLNPHLNDANLDPDNDHLTNIQEFKLGFNPKDSKDGLGDQDNDKLPTWWEIKYELDPFNASDALLDYDNDTLTNLAEYMNNLNPITVNDKLIDSNHDGLTNYEKVILKLDPHKTDTDGDGVSDYLEVKIFGFLGSSPTNANDSPVTRIMMLLILTLVCYGLVTLAKIQYNEWKEKEKIKYNNMITEIQILLDTVNQDYSELVNQISVLENDMKNTLGTIESIHVLKKSTSALYGPLRELERYKTRLNLYRNNTILKESVIQSMDQITDLSSRYLRLKEQISFLEKHIQPFSQVTHPCSTCGTMLEPTAQECPKCHTSVQTCAICKKSIIIGQEVAECIHCHHIFHYGHFAETVKIQGRCPICFETIKTEEINPFVISEVF